MLLSFEPFTTISTRFVSVAEVLLRVCLTVFSNVSLLAIIKLIKYRYIIPWGWSNMTRPQRLFRGLYDLCKSSRFGRHLLSINPSSVKPSEMPSEETSSQHDKILLNVVDYLKYLLDIHVPFISTFYFRELYFEVHSH